MKQSIYAMVLVVMTMGLAACQKNSSDNKERISANNLSYQYKISMQGTNSRNCRSCTVPQWSSKSLDSYCNRLADHAANNYCAQEEREIWFTQANCKGNFVRDTATPKCNATGAGRYLHTMPPNQTTGGNVSLSNYDYQRINTIYNRGIDYNRGGFTGFYCTTGDEQLWGYNNTHEFCSKIQDDTLNAGCAHGVRKQLFNTYCKNLGTYQAKNEYYRFDMQAYEQSRIEYVGAGFLDIFSLDSWENKEYNCEGAYLATNDRGEYCQMLKDPTLESTCFSHPGVAQYRDQTYNEVCR